ncbi:uncharacterized protein LOC134707878 [Mytilus trossulus]|uniref:uncharacterized protein LOC134707878 n=1 Tax=Mytilus trossulus TaxID=6551 RepID=UPI003005BE99
MEGKAVVIFLGCISCVFAGYPVTKKCANECSSRLDCGRGYYCQTIGCNRRCTSLNLPIGNAHIDQVVSQDTFALECELRCRQQGRVGCRRLCQQNGDQFLVDQRFPVDSLDHSFQGSSVDRAFPGDSLGSIRSGSLVDRIRSIGPVDRTFPGASLGSIRTGSLVDRIRSIGPVESIHHKGCENMCISRNQCKLNEDCVSRDGCNVCVRVSSYA